MMMSISLLMQHDLIELFKVKLIQMRFSGGNSTYLHFISYELLHAISST